MATYPDDATATLAAFPVTSTVTYNNTGLTTTAFNLSAAVSLASEVGVFIDGVTQATDSYTLSNGGATVTFVSAPNASNLTLQTLSIPEKLKTTKQTFTTLSVDYGNTTAKVINGNSYIVNSFQESFALPAGSDITSADSLQVFVSGVFQQEAAFTFPSVTLGFDGIDVGDNAAVKLVTNFFGNVTDDSPSNHTVQQLGSPTFVDFGDDKFIDFDGSSDYLRLPVSTDFNLREKSFTYDTWARPDTGTSMTANQTLFASYLDGDNYYALRIVGSNSNVGFVYQTSNSLVEVYGGNCNGGSNYHVAVSSETTTNNLRLYVNNVLVGHTNYSLDYSFSGANAYIGSNNTTGAELFKGGMSFSRLAHATRYRSSSHEPLATTNALSVISAAPLGSVDENDTLSIRMFDSTIETIDRFSSMIDRKPDRGISSERSFDTITFASQAGYEKRRLKSRRSKRSYDLTYTAITGVEKVAIENFYIARSGDFESFNFDLAHINESGTIVTRFEGGLSIEQTYSNGSRLIDNFYTVSFKLQEVYD